MPSLWQLHVSGTAALLILDPVTHWVCVQFLLKMHLYSIAYNGPQGWSLSSDLFWVYFLFVFVLTV